MAEASQSKQDNLKRALKEFSHSPRYPLFKGVTVGRLLPEGTEATGRLSEITFEDLTRLYSSSSDLEMAFSAEQEQSLLHLVSALVEEGQDEMASVGSEQVIEPKVRSSVQTELELRQILKTVTSHPQYNTVRNRTLGEYWRPEWTPAPFEEAMTIAQLAAFDITVLFKKKMVSDTRVHSIYQALEAVLAELSGSVATPSRVSEVSTKAARGVALSQNQSLSAAAYYELLHQAKIGQAYPELKNIVSRFLDTFSFDECAQIISPKSLSKSCMKRLAGLVKEELSEATRDLLQSLLRAPSVRVDHIARILHGSNQPISALSRIVATIVARGLGASAVTINNAVVDGLWTLNPQLLSIAVAALQRDKVSAGRFDLDPILQDFIKQSENSHGRSVPRRKDRRNRLKSRHRSGK